MKIKKGDTVKVLLGKDKGRTGEVVVAQPKNNSVVVKGLNLYKKHVKSTQNQSGGIVEKERPLLVSKVALLCPGCKKPVRVKYSLDKNGTKYRICPKCQSLLDTKAAK